MRLHVTARRGTVRHTTSREEQTVPRPPSGHVDMTEAESITGYERHAIAAAAQRGEITGAFQRVRKSPWFFTADGLKTWSRGETDTSTDAPQAGAA
jgi:hypothetical protein